MPAMGSTNNCLCYICGIAPTAGVRLPACSYSVTSPRWPPQSSGQPLVPPAVLDRYAIAYGLCAVPRFLWQGFSVSGWKDHAQLFASHLGKVKPATRFVGSKQRVSFELSHKSEAGGVNHPLSIEGLKGSPRLQSRLNAYVIGDSSWTKWFFNLPLCDLLLWLWNGRIALCCLTE